MPVKLVQGSLRTGDSQDHDFSTDVVSASAQVSSFKLSYDLPLADMSGGKDHHVETVRAAVSIATSGGSRVSVKADGSIEDQGGNRGGGEVGYLLIAETE